MSRDCGNAPKSKKHISESNPMTKQNRKSYRRVSDSSSLSSNRNSPAQSDDDWNYSSQAVKNVTEEEKDGMLKKLQCQVKELRHKLKVLEDCVENKDYAIGTLTREKDRALGEIRRLEKSNKQLRQQLNDERDYYLGEKEKFCQEMTRYKKRIQDMRIAGESGSVRGPALVTSKISAGTWQKGDSAEINPVIDAVDNALASRSEFKKGSSVDSLTLYEGQDLSLQMAALRTENAKLKAIINEREERNYELCLRFLRMKHSKNDLRNRFQDLEHEYLQVITQLMEKIDEAREEFNFIIDQKFKKPLHSTNANYIKMVQKNSKITHENITLRMELQSMRKQLSNGNIGQGDCGRKPDEPKKSNSDDKPNISKKAAGVRQMKSDGNLLPKASDTDSNYMSKTWTTDPSTGSVGDTKSNESIYNESVNMKSKTPNTQNTLFSNDILQKIFETVDTQSNSNIHGNPSARKAGSKNGKLTEHKELPNIPAEGTGKRYVACSLNAKKFHEITAHATAKKSTVSTKDKKATPLHESNIDKKKSDEPRRKLSDLSGRPKSRSHFTELKRPIRPYAISDKPQESQSDGVSLKGSSSSIRVKDKNIVYHFGNSRRIKLRRECRQKSCIRDSCGLEEKLDSDGEMSADYDYETSDRTPRSEKMIDEMTMVKHRLTHDVRRSVWHESQAREVKDTNSEDSAIGSFGTKIRNRNSVSLHDELMEATKSQSQTDDPFWRRELNLHSLITKKSASSSRTYRLNARKARYRSEGHNTPDVMDEDDGVNLKEVDVGVGTTIEEESRCVGPVLKNKSGSHMEMPVNMTHKATGVNSMLLADRNSEFVLRFLMPPTAILSAQSFLYDENCKESSARSGKEQGSTPHSVRQLMIPASNAPSSCTTVDLLESPPPRENGLTSRTLSAPALIESEWFNNFKMCEMKDCSTNT